MMIKPKIMLKEKNLIYSQLHSALKIHIDNAKTKNIAGFAMLQMAEEIFKLVRGKENFVFVLADISASAI